MTQRMKAAVFTVLWIAVMVIIFLFSNDDAEASSAKSGAVVVIVETVEEVLDLTPTQEIRAMTETIVRKCAHVFLYTCLGITGTLAVREYIGLILAKMQRRRNKTESCGQTETTVHGKSRSEEKEAEAVNFPEMKPGKFRAVTVTVTYLLCFLYACTDEWHQTFRSGRSGSFRDVLIDSIGMVLGIGISSLILMLLDHFRTKKQKSEKACENEPGGVFYTE